MASKRSNVPASLVTKRSSPGNEPVSDDLFSTLFSSDMTAPTNETDNAKYRPMIQDTSESDSEFGAFVSVPAAEDPLAALDFGLPEQGGSPSIDKHMVSNNPSLTFFDKFAQDAKVASDRNKQGVLDELLKHEDDPLYWLKNEHKTPAASQPAAHTADLVDFHHKYSNNVHTLLENGESVIERQQQPEIVTDHANRKGAMDDLLDLDQDFFTSKTPVHQPRPHMATGPGHSPSRSSTLSLPVVPAPPIADTHNAELFTSSPSNDSDSLSPVTRFKTRRFSHSTLSNLSSRFVSTFLASSKPPSHHSHSSLESIFAADSTRHRRSQSSERTSPSSTKLYRTASQPVSDVQISHGTPFGRPIETKISPFASHIYIPPSGAPGYRGEQYDWDKGFSDDLDRELIREEVKEQELVGLKGSAPTPDVAYLIEKKTGSVDLNGRKTTTAPVLDVYLADLIRPHLPALARLPRKWTLIYSLDQHGISLNTLYDRCEAHMQVKPGTSAPAGALLVIKDAGDALFGAWMGKEGVHPSRGKGYYGSGESFLWKYIGGNLQVFKWTGKNDYVALCEPKYISFGGGDGNYGLYLDESLFEGSSAACPTFANEPLCSTGTKNAGVVAFECVGDDGIGSCGRTNMEEDAVRKNAVHHPLKATGIDGDTVRYMKDDG
ncbi:hypothetical protein C0995_007388 [Termitomyces sp. Mi166|nr:hypothetical protein C0995_007388 [Termitomyces sp. Mi166\